MLILMVMEARIHGMGLGDLAVRRLGALLRWLGALLRRLGAWLLWRAATARAMSNGSSQWGMDNSHVGGSGHGSTTISTKIFMVMVVMVSAMLHEMGLWCC